MLEERRLLKELTEGSEFSFNALYNLSLIHIYLIEPGTYAILNYWWTESKWYGGRSYMEPIYKGEDSIQETERKIKSKEQRPDELVLFKFSVAENTLNYVGTWHFENSPVFFTNDKEETDEEMQDKYKKLDFRSSRTAIPD